MKEQAVIAAMVGSQQPVETHPFAPFLPKNSKVLLLGTFPPTEEKRAMDFYYPNFQNDMWRIMGLIFAGDSDALRKGEEKAFDAGKIKALCTEKGIALGPTVLTARREKGNASDKFLQVIEEAPLAAMLVLLPECHALAATGEKAASIVLNQCKEPPKMPKTGETVAITLAALPGRKLTLTRLPSTSRAYPLKLEKKKEAYGKFFKKIGIL